MLYSKETGGFYLPKIHGANIPADAVEISADEHASLLAGQAAGQHIVSAENGRPVLADQLPFVPQSVTMRQARLALLGAGLLGQVDAAIDSLPSPHKEAARIEWEYSQEVQRTKPLVLTLAPALNLTEADLDALFVAAAAL